jgi:uncharacterized protein (DUF433 family)
MNTQTYEQWKLSLTRDPRIMGGSPCFPNTRITVNRIVDLQRRGEKRQTILEDYPPLSNRDLDFAFRYSQDPQ